MKVQAEEMLDSLLKTMSVSSVAVSELLSAVNAGFPSKA